MDANGRQRLRSNERRGQIVDVTLRLVATHGVTGTTLARIAAVIGVTPQALYAHFPSRKQLLLAALNVLFDKIRANHRDLPSEDAIEQLREVGLRHTRLISAGQDGFVSSYFEFIAAPPREGLREALAAGNALLVQDLVDIVQDGQRQGTIRPEVDPYQVAWLMTSRAWTEDVAQLIGVSDQWDQWTEGRSNEMLEMILSMIAAPGHPTV